MHTENLVILLLAHDLHKSFFLAKDSRFARCRKRELTDLYVVTRFFRFRFRQTNRSDFRVAVRAVGDEPQIDWLRMLGREMFDGHDTFLGSEVGEEWRRYHVTDR